MRKSMPMILRVRSHLRARLIAGVLNAIPPALILGAMLAIPTAALSQPPIAITTCQKITKPGLYEIDNILIA